MTLPPIESLLPEGPELNKLPRLDWHLADVVTGKVRTRLPLDGGDTIRSTIMKADTQTFTLNVADPQCPDNWHDLLVPGRTMIVLTLDDRPTNGWLVTEPTIGGPTVPFDGVTLEDAFEAYVPEVDGTDLDDSEVLARIFTPLRDWYGFGIVWTPCGYSTGAFYDADTDLTMLDAATALNAGPGRPEVRIEYSWADHTHLRLLKTIVIGPRVGRRRPDAIFSRDAKGRGNIESYTRIPSYAGTKGFTALIGVSGTGDGRASVGPIISPLVDQGWPRKQRRVTFTGLDATTIADEDIELARRTEQELRMRQAGTTSWRIVGGPTAPRPGVDYDIGDTVPVRIDPQGKQDPVGGSLDMRVLSWEFTPASGTTVVLPWEDPDGDET